jgi:hypothetical protein
MNSFKSFLTITACLAGAVVTLTPDIATADRLIKASATAHVEVKSFNRSLQPGELMGLGQDDDLAQALSLADFPIDLEASNIREGTLEGVQVRAHVDAKEITRPSPSGVQRLMEIDIATHTLIFPWARFGDRADITISAIIEFERTTTGPWRIEFNPGSDMSHYGHFADGAYRVADLTGARITLQRYCTMGGTRSIGFWVDVDELDSERLNQETATIDMDWTVGRMRMIIELERTDIYFSSDGIQQIWDGMHVTASFD